MLYIKLLRADVAYVDRATTVYRWPEPGRGATFNRRRVARQEISGCRAARRVRPVLDPVLRAQSHWWLAQVVAMRTSLGRCRSQENYGGSCGLVRDLPIRSIDAL